MRAFILSLALLLPASVALATEPQPQTQLSLHGQLGSLHNQISGLGSLVHGFKTDMHQQSAPIWHNVWSIPTLTQSQPHMTDQQWGGGFNLFSFGFKPDQFD